MRINTKVVYDMETGKVIERECYDYPDDAPLALCNKAIEGAALLAGAAVLSAVVLPAGSALIPYAVGLELSLAAQGVAMEAGAIAEALTANRGMNITTRQPAANRQIIYGMQRVGGVEIYKSTTGSHKDQLNYVIVIAGHPCESLVNLYLDGRQVHFASGGANQTVGGFNFGGNADGNSYTGPDGVQYNFGGLVYCEARYGTQTEGEDTATQIMGSLRANDPLWDYDAAGDSPWVAGCTYIYLKVESYPEVFPSEPEIRITVMGKDNIYDPRTQAYGYSSNWALCAADIITDPQFGLGDNNVNQVQLIAAANICDELVFIAQLNESEARYAYHAHYDTSTSPGDALANMMAGACGSLSFIGGQYFIWPDAYISPTAAFSEQHLTSSIQWQPNRSVPDLYNVVEGTYIAPSFPWNIAGNLYDKNGFYNGYAQNNFSFAFQPTNFPAYAADVLHGYPDDQYLMADGGIVHPMELNLQTVLSVTQAQRVAKLHLKHNRMQGTGTLEMNLSSYIMQPKDTFYFTYSPYGWENKLLEVTAVNFNVATDDSSSGPTIRVSYNVRETDSSVYDWSDIEELTVYDIAALPSQTPRIPAPPTNMTLTSGPGVAQINPDGTVNNIILVSWDTPLDNLAIGINVQYQLDGTDGWFDAPSALITTNSQAITNITPGQLYNVQIRSYRANGSTSEWLVENGYAVGTTETYLGTLGAELPAIQANSALGGTVPGEILSNPNFVYGLTQWSSGGTGSPTVDTTQHKLGTQSIRLQGGAISQSVSLTAGHTYTAAAWVMTNGSVINGGSQGIGLYVYDPGQAITVQKVNKTGVNLNNTYPGVIIPTSVAIPWTLVQMTFSVGVTGAYVFTLSDNYGSNAVNAFSWFDGVTLVDTAGAADVTSAQPIVYAATSESIVANGNFILGNMNGWSAGAFTYGMDGFGPRIYSPAYGASNPGAFSQSFSVIPGSKYRLVYTVYNGSGSGGIYLRISWQGTYGAVVIPVGNASTNPGNEDFLANGSVSVIPTAYTYDWVAPAGAYYASMCIYCVGASDLACQSVACYPYVGVSEWGADVTGANTSALTASLANQTLDNLPDGVTYLKPTHVGAGGIYYSSSAFIKQGGLVQTIVNGIFTFTVNNSSISAWNSAETLPFPDNTFINVPATGSSSSPAFNFEGLTASTGYYVSAYFDIAANQVQMIMSDVNGGLGIPSVLQQITITNGDGHIALGVGILITTGSSSTSTGGGSGGGSPPGTCPAEDQLMETQELGFVAAALIDAGMHIRDIDDTIMWNLVHSAHSVEAALHHVTITTGDDTETYHVDLDHRWLRPGGDAMSSETGPDWILSHTLNVGDYVQGADGWSYQVTDISQPHLGFYRKIHCERKRMRMGKLVAHNWNTIGST